MRHCVPLPIPLLPCEHVSFLDMLNNVPSIHSRSCENDSFTITFLSNAQRSRETPTLTVELSCYVQCISGFIRESSLILASSSRWAWVGYRILRQWKSKHIVLSLTQCTQFDLVGGLYTSHCAEESN